MRFLAPRMALVLLLLAAPAQARTRYLSPVGSNAATGVDSAHPWLTFFYALCNLNSLDTLRCANGTYSDGIIPREYCGVYGVVVIGDSINPNKCVIPGINVSANSSTMTNCGRLTVNGFRINGSVNVQETPSTGGNADGFILRNCVLAGSFQGLNTDFSAYKTRFGTGQDSVNAWVRSSAAVEPVTIVLDSCRIISAPLTAPLEPGFMIAFQSGSGSLGQQGYIAIADAANHLTMTHDTLRVFAPNGYSPAKYTIFQGLNDCLFEDTRFEHRDSTGLTSDSQGFLFRDNLQRNVWNRDTFDLHTFRAGKGTGRVQLTGPGATIQGASNVYRNCLFKSDMAGSLNFPQFDYAWQMQPGDSFYRNVVICSTGVGRSAFHVNTVVGNAYVGQNTFMNEGAGGAVMLNDDAKACPGGANCCWSGRLTFVGNILYSQSTATGSTDYAMAAVWPYSGNSVLVSDYNLFAHYGSSSGLRSFHGNYCGGTAANYSPTTANTAFGNDAHSVYGSPRFTDSTFFGFNATLLPSSRAIGNGPIGNAVGASEVDQARPYRIEDLAVIGSSATQVILQWTATGDDSLTGTCTSYVLRYNTSEITDSNWGTSTDVTGEPTPGVFGAPQAMQISGLSASTTYYFAIKAVDDAGNQSALSTLAVSTTQMTGSPGFADP